MSRHTLHDRDKALSRALALFWRKGYHATSLKDLELALDMRPGSIYAAFKSKENLFRLVLDRYAADMRVQTEAVFADAPSPLSGIAAYMRRLGGLRDADQPSCACMLMKTILEMPDADAPAFTEAEALLARVEAGFVARFTQARRIGELPPEADPERLARLLQISVMGLKAYAQRGANSGDIRAAAEDIAAGIEALADPAFEAPAPG
jgi:AcrR family transcriptional regulator